MVTDQIADLLTRVRNAQRAGHPAVMVPASRSKERILNLFVDEGFVAKVEQVDDAKGKPALKVYLRYQDNGTPVIREVKRISRPGRRIYVGKDEIPRNRGGLGLIVVSTPQGLLSDREARKRGVGGEVVCSVL